MDEIALLSPNGQQETTGEGPATRLFVATVRGILRIERRASDQLWDVACDALREQHASSLLLSGTGTLFAGTHGGGIWRSDDGSGATWRQVSRGIGQTNIYSLACRQHGNDIVLFAGAEPASIYRSTDLGENWREMPALRCVPGTDKWHFPPPPHIAHVKSITLHPARPTTLFACVEQGALLTSEDDGGTWHELDDYSHPDDPTYRDTHRIALHPRHPEIAYLTTGVGAYRSDDGGRHWRALTRRGSRLGYPDFIFLDPENPDSLHIAGAEKSPKEWPADGTANSAVLKSEDGGRSWRELRTGLGERINGGIEAMSRHRWLGGTMLSFATAKGEIYMSEDDGEQWSLAARDLPPISKSVHYRAFLPGARERGRAAYG